MGRAVEPAEVLEREEEGEDVFQHGEQTLPCRGDVGHTLHDDQQDAGHDGPEQGHVESLAHRRVALEDDDVEPLLQGAAFMGCLPQTGGCSVAGVLHVLWFILVSESPGGHEDRGASARPSISSLFI